MVIVQIGVNLTMDKTMNRAKLFQEVINIIRNGKLFRARS